MIPKLRFKSFSSPLSKYKVGDILERFSDPVSVSETEKYREIGIRSHGKGLFHKNEVHGAVLGSKRVFWIKKDALIINIVFAWEQAIALTSSNEEGFIASHRFPMYLPKSFKYNTNYIRWYFLTRKGKKLLELASPGGAGRNKTLGQKNFEDLVLTIPDILEQNKIAHFLSSIEDKISLLNKQKELLLQYKKGIIQNIFSQKVRFKDEDNKHYPAWKKVRLGDFLISFNKRVPSDTSIPVYTSSRTGLKPQFDYFDNRELLNEGEYGVVPEGYITYRHMSDDSTFKFNKNTTGAEIAVSKEYPVFKTSNLNLDFLMFFLNESDDFKKFSREQKAGGTRVRLYYKKLCEWDGMIYPNLEEQIKIAKFLSALDEKIHVKNTELIKIEYWKQGLLQKMFI